MAIDVPMTRDEVHILLNRLFAAFLNPAVGLEQFADFLTPDYVQRVDGKQLDYAGFLAHTRALRASVLSTTVTFEHIVTDGLSAATVHAAEAVKTDGRRICLKVIAYYQFRGHRISLVDELTHLIAGETSDRDLGSRMHKHVS